MEEILIQIYDWFFGNPYDVTMADPLTAIAVGSAVVSGLGALFGGGAKKRAARAARRRQETRR